MQEEICSNQGDGSLAAGLSGAVGLIGQWGTTGSGGVGVGEHWTSSSCSWRTRRASSSSWKARAWRPQRAWRQRGAPEDGSWRRMEKRWGPRNWCPQAPNIAVLLCEQSVDQSLLSTVVWMIGGMFFHYLCLWRLSYIYVLSPRGGLCWVE